MKKYLFLLPALVLALLLAACVSDETEETAGPTPTSTETAGETLSPAPAGSPDPEGADAPAGSFEVYTDWSKLEPYEPKQAVYTRRYEGFTDTLIPADDYGPLIGFAGTHLTLQVPPFVDMYDGYDTDLYGLVTLQGEVVLDPVLSTAVYLTAYDQWHGPLSVPNVMLLGKTLTDEDGGPEERYALCAVDGSWCTDFLYDDHVTMSLDQGILMQRGGKLVWVEADTGREVRTMDLGLPTGAYIVELEYVPVDPETGWVGVNGVYRSEGNYDYFNRLFDPRGRACPLPQDIQWIGQYGNGKALAIGIRDGERLYGYVEAETGKWAIEPAFDDARPFVNGVAPVRSGNTIYFINTAGEAVSDHYVFPDGDYVEMPEYHEGCWYLKGSDKLYEVLNEDLNAVDSPLRGVRSYSFCSEGWIHGETSTDSILARWNEVHYFRHGRGYIAGVNGDRVLFIKNPWQATPATLTITDLEGTEVACIEKYAHGVLETDALTGEGYLYAYTISWPQRTDLYDLDGALLYEGTIRCEMRGGLIYIPGEEATTLTDREGNVVFCWPIDRAED